MDTVVREQIISKLYDCYMANGFIAEDEAISLFVTHDVPLHQIDSITEQLLTMGVIIAADTEDELFNDRSKTDYNEIFNEVVEQVPELEPMIGYIRSIARPLRNEWQKLMPQAQNGNEYAKNRLYEMYLRVVVRQALECSKRFHLPLEDTLQDGFIGAMSSVDNYNPAEHMNYATTIQWRISQAISRNRWLYNNPAYFPVHIKDKLFAIMNEVEEHYCADCAPINGNLCTQLVKSISGKNEWTIEETTKNIRYLISWISLAEVVGSDEIIDDSEFLDEVFESLEISYNRTVIFEAMEGFKERDRAVIMLRYGFTDKGVLTLENIGQIFSLTRERVRQIEAKALRKLRKKLSGKYPELSKKKEP